MVIAQAVHILGSQGTIRGIITTYTIRIVYLFQSCILHEVL